MRFCSTAGTSAIIRPRAAPAIHPQQLLEVDSKFAGATRRGGSPGAADHNFRGDKSRIDTGAAKQMALNEYGIETGLVQPLGQWGASLPCAYCHGIYNGVTLLHHVQTTCV